MPAHERVPLLTQWFDRRLLCLLAICCFGSVRQLSAQPAGPAANLEALQDQMLAAAAEGRIKAVEACLQSGADLHYINPFGYTVLASALMHEQWETADQLLKLGFAPTQAIPGKTLQVGWSSLSAAVLKHRADWAQRLLALGVDPNGRGTLDVTRNGLAGPLLAAVRDGRADFVDLLMQAGANAGDAGYLSNEVVMVAIEQKNLKVLQALLAHGASPTDVGRQMLSPLAFACRSNWTDGITIFIRAGADPYAFSTTSISRGQTAFAAATNPATRDYLWKACLDYSIEKGALTSETAALCSALYARDSAKFTQVLQKTGTPSGALLGLYPLLPFALMTENEDAAIALFKAGVEAQPYFQGQAYNPLTHAVDHGYLKLLEVLLDGGLDPRVAPSQGWSPMGLASARGNLAAIKLLVAHQAVINPDPAYPKSSPLMLAASNGHPATVDWLLANGANVDLVDEGGNTALMWGAWLGSAEIVKALLKAGSKIDHRNKTGDSALAMAATENKLPATEALLQAGARDDFLVQTLREKNIAGPVMDLVARFHGKAVAAPTATEFFSLPRTAAEVRTFIGRGGDINYVGESTPLQTVIGRGEFQTAALLLNLGVDPNALGKHERRSPLLIAVYAASTRLDDKEALPIIKLLLESGVNPNGTDPELKPPLHLAITGGLIDTVNLLLLHGADPRIKTLASQDAFQVLFQTNIPMSVKIPIGRAMESVAKRLPPLPEPKPEPTKKITF